MRIYVFPVATLVFFSIECKRVCLLLLLTTTTDPIRLREELSSPTEKKPKPNRNATFFGYVLYSIVVLGVQKLHNHTCIVT